MTTWTKTVRLLSITTLGVALAAGPALADEAKEPAAPAKEQAKPAKKKARKAKKKESAEKEGAAGYTGMRTSDQVRQDNQTRQNYDNARKTYK